MQKRVTNRRGYVLVMTLGLIALSAISLTQVAQYSLGLASRAEDETEELQRRWGLLSCRLVLLEQAGAILDSQLPESMASTPPWPKPSRISVTFTLGDQQFAVNIADENAKANINTIYAFQPAKLPSAIRHLSQDSAMLAVRLRPEQVTTSAFRSWGQVFDVIDINSEMGVAAGLLTATSEMTCWGGGRLNIRRATDTAIFEIASTALATKDANELIILRKNWGGRSVDELVAQLGLKRPQQSAVSRLLTTESNDYSMWVAINNGQRSWFYQYAGEHGSECFAW